MKQEPTVTIDKDDITVTRTQMAHGQEIRVVSVFLRQGRYSPMDKLKALIDLELQKEMRSA